MRISVKCTNGQFLALNWICCSIHFWFYVVGVSPCVFPPCVLLPALTHLPDVSHLCAPHLSVLPCPLRVKKPDLPACCCCLSGGSSGPCFSSLRLRDSCLMAVSCVLGFVSWLCPSTGRLVCCVLFCSCVSKRLWASDKQEEKFSLWV